MSSFRKITVSTFLAVHVETIKFQGKQDNFRYNSNILGNYSFLALFSKDELIRKVESSTNILSLLFQEDFAS